MSTVIQGPARGGLLEVARGLEPVLRRHAPEAERSKRLSDSVVEAMRAAGLYRLWRPAAFGGHEADPVTGFQVIEEVARIDSAAAWNLQLSAGLDFFGAWFSDSAAREIFGDPDAVLGGAFYPPRRAVVAAGGYRLSGRTPFVSGCHNDTWFLGLANVFDGDQMRLGSDGRPLTLLTAFPASEGEIVENWNTMGMCGTGSHDVSVNDLLVPESRAVPLVPLEHPGEVYGGALYRLTVWPPIAALAPPALGIARAAVEDAVALIGAKTPAYLLNKLRDRTVVHRELALAKASLASGRAYLYKVFGDLYEKAVGGHRMTLADRAEAQLAITNAVRASADTVDRVHEIVGATGIRNEYPFQRYFRDVHVLTQHGFVNAAKLESVGQVMLGLEPEWPFFAF